MPTFQGFSTYFAKDRGQNVCEINMQNMLEVLQEQHGTKQKTQMI